MGPFDVKKKLYSEMVDDAKSSGLADLRAKYGAKPAMPMHEAPAELADDELEPLLSITIAQGKPGVAEVMPDEEEAEEEDPLAEMG